MVIKMNLKQYIDFLCDLLAIDIPKVQIHQNNKYMDIDGNICNHFTLKKTSIATAYPTENLICIDMDRANNDLIYAIIAHELRHIYQYQAVQNPSWKEELSSVWELEFATYEDSSHDDYENQSIEIDAWAFSKLIFNFIFRKDFTVHCNRNALDIRLQELTIDFPRDDIIDSYEFCIGEFNNYDA